MNHNIFQNKNQLQTVDMFDKRVLIKSFNLRDCTLREFNSRKDPCLLYQMKQCSAPCVGKIDDISYSEDLTLCLDFFRGNGDKSISVLAATEISPLSFRAAPPIC